MDTDGAPLQLRLLWAYLGSEDEFLSQLVTSLGW
jgi:hypothetical protein